MSDFQFTDNSPQFIEAMRSAVGRALEAAGTQAESYAKRNITEGVPRNPGSWYTPTGHLRNSMAHEVHGDTAYIGSDLEYAVYNEVGTGKYTDPELGGGRQTPWWYMGSDGQMHKTEGMKPLHFLKRAMTEHKDEYFSIMEDELRKN